MTNASRRQLVSATALLGGAIFVSSAGNYVLNLVLARMLDRSAFGDASLMVTWMLALTSVAVGFQLVTVRQLSKSDTALGAATIRNRLLIRSAIAGLLIAAAMALGSPALKSWFQTASTAPFLILAAGVPFYLGLAVDRGVCQSELAFTRLAASYIVESVVRVSAASLLVAVGFGVEGATWGLTASFAASWIVVWRSTACERRSTTPDIEPFIRTLGPIGVLLVAQVIINNADILLAKSSFTPEDAGTYMAVALVGRAVFFGSWAIVQVVLPSAISGTASERASALRFGLVMVSGCSLLAAASLFAAGPLITSMLFGSGFGDMAPLMAPYALAAGMFAVANLLATVDVTRGNLTSTTTLAVGAVVQTLALGTFTATPAQMVWTQVGFMCLTTLIVFVVRFEAVFDRPVAPSPNSVPVAA